MTAALLLWLRLRCHPLKWGIQEKQRARPRGWGAVALIESERLCKEQSSLHPIWRSKNQQHYIKTMGGTRWSLETEERPESRDRAAARKAVPSPLCVLSYHLKNEWI